MNKRASKRKQKHPKLYTTIGGVVLYIIYPDRRVERWSDEEEAFINSNFVPEALETIDWFVFLGEIK